MNQQDYLDIATAADKAVFTQRLVGFADKLGFPLVSAILVLDRPADVPLFLSVGNTPQGYQDLFADAGRSRRCPVLTRLKTHGRPLTYDQALYVQDGVPEQWESQAPFGYCTGVAMAQHMPGGRHLLMGVDRPEPLPDDEEQLIRLMADLQLLGAFAQETAVRVLTPPGPALGGVPELSARELEVLRWTRDGKSAEMIGEIMHLSERTVRYHLRNAEGKLKVSGKHQAVVKAMGLGLL